MKKQIGLIFLVFISLAMTLNACATAPTPTPPPSTSTPSPISPTSTLTLTLTPTLALTPTLGIGVPVNDGHIEVLIKNVDTETELKEFFTTYKAKNGYVLLVVYIELSVFDQTIWDEIGNKNILTRATVLMEDRTTVIAVGTSSKEGEGNIEKEVFWLKKPLNQETGFVFLLKSEDVFGKILSFRFHTAPPIPFTVVPTTSAPSQTLLPTPIETEQHSEQAQSSQVLFLRQRCGDSYTVQADKPLEIRYGAWGAIGEELAKQNAQHLVVNLILDGKPVSGIQQPVAPFASTIPCGSPPNDTYGVFYIAKIDSLSVGEHTASVTFILNEQVTDGYDSDDDGKPDVYGPGEVFTHQFTIVAK